MSSSPVADGEGGRNKLAELEAIMQVVETEAANLKQVLHSLAATSSTGVLAPAASAVLTTALQSTVSMKKNVSKAREFFALNFDDLGSSEEAWTCLRKMEDLKECVVDRDMPLLLHQAIAAVIKITNVAGKKILEFPFGDAEWRECIRFRYARTNIFLNPPVLDNGKAAVSLQNIVIRRLQAAGIDYRRAFLTLVHETMEACPAINTVAQVGIATRQRWWDEPSWDYADECKLKRRIAFRVVKPEDVHKRDIHVGDCYGYSATGRRSGEVVVDTGVSVNGRTVSFWSANLVQPERRNISYIGDGVERFLFDSEEDAERVAAAVRAAILIWQDEGDSLRQSGRLPGYTGLEGMLEKPEAVRCVLDVGDDFYQDGDADFDMTLLDAIDVVKGEKYRTYHGIEDSKTLEFRLFAALPIEGNVPRDAVLAEEQPTDAAAEQ